MTDSISAYERLLQAPELLELVLRELDPLELICRVPLVCRLWRDVIATSPRLQAKIFMRPEATTWTLDPTVKPEQNPQVWKRTCRLQDLFQAKEEDVATIQKGQERSRTGRRGSADKISGISASSNAAPYSFMGPWQHSISSPQFTRPGVSWRKMLIQQPAIHSFGQVLVRKRLDGSIQTKVGKVDFPDGIRMGHVWDSLRQSMVLLKSDMCLMRLVWWEPTITSFERALYPMAQDVSRLFEQGAQLVLAIGFSECHPQDRFYGKFASEYESLCHCEEYNPPDFNFQESVHWPGPERRQSLA